VAHWLARPSFYSVVQGVNNKKGLAYRGWMRAPKKIPAPQRAIELTLLQNRIHMFILLEEYGFRLSLA